MLDVLHINILRKAYELDIILRQSGETSSSKNQCGTYRGEMKLKHANSDVARLACHVDS